MSRFKPDNDEIFIQLPAESGERVLHRTRHVGTQGEELALDLEQPLQLALEQPLFLYYERKRKFMQQPARIVAVALEGSITVEPTADPIVAESRQAYRCPTLVEDIVARLGSEARCEVLDVSETGFAVLAHTTYAPGSMLDVELTLEGEAAEGTAVVQSVNVPASGLTRYGLRVVGGTLLDALPRFTLTVQRNQLRRRSGA